MRIRTAICALALAAALAGAPAAASAAVILATNSAADCGASGCAWDAAGSYRQTWSAAMFDGPQTISSLRLARSVLGDYAGETFQITFWTGDGATQVGDFGLFTITGFEGDEVLLTSMNGFQWDPAQGDLMLRISIWGMDDARLPESYRPLTLASFAAAPLEDEGGEQTLPIDPPGDEPLVDPLDIVEPLDQPGPDDDLQDRVSPAPEPGTWALLIAGFGLAGAALRSRRRSTFARIP